MNFKEAIRDFCLDNTVSVLLKTKDGLRTLSENNFSGGACGCCEGCESSDDLEVVRIVDLETMEILYDEKSMEAQS